MILVTGANGLAGSTVIREFARTYSPVRALVRSRAKAQALETLPMVELVEGDMLRLRGSRMLEVLPVVPLNPVNQRLSVGIVSFDGGVFFGLLADRDLDPPVEVAAEALRAALAELLEPASTA